MSATREKVTNEGGNEEKEGMHLSDPGRWCECDGIRLSLSFWAKIDSTTAKKRWREQSETSKSGLAHETRGLFCANEKCKVCTLKTSCWIIFYCWRNILEFFFFWFMIKKNCPTPIFILAAFFSKWSNFFFVFLCVSEIVLKFWPSEKCNAPVSLIVKENSLTKAVQGRSKF